MKHAMSAAAGCLAGIGGMELVEHSYVLGAVLVVLGIVVYGAATLGRARGGR